MGRPLFYALRLYVLSCSFKEQLDKQESLFLIVPGSFSELARKLSLHLNISQDMNAGT
jgi:hypothetical protein